VAVAVHANHDLNLPNMATTIFDIDAAWTKSASRQWSSLLRPESLGSKQIRAQASTPTGVS
jgi:hypothetical protein